MNTNILEYVLTVAEERSFSKAAKRLYISQPSLSQRIIDLEKELGTQLFDRSTTPLSLTYAGEKYVEYAIKILNIERELDMQIGDIINNHRGRLIIGISLFRNSTILSQVLPVFFKLYPEVKIIIKEATNDKVIEMAANGETDLSFINNTVPANLDGIHLLKDKVLLAVGKQHPICRYFDFTSGYPKINLTMLKDEPFALTSPQSNLRKIADAIFNDYNFIPKIAIETSSLELAHKFTVQNTSVAVVLESLLHLYPEDQRARYFILDLKDYDNDLFICYKKNRYITKIMSSFIKITKDTVKKQKLQL